MDDVVGEHVLAGQPDESLTVEQRIDRARWEGEVKGLRLAMTFLQEARDGKFTLR
jgi:hypothetical protein